MGSFAPINLPWHCSEHLLSLYFISSDCRASLWFLGSISPVLHSVQFLLHSVHYFHLPVKAVGECFLEMDQRKQKAVLLPILPIEGSWPLWSVKGYPKLRTRPLVASQYSLGEGTFKSGAKAQPCIEGEDMESQ
jgi:hypothetical protein